MKNKCKLGEHEDRRMKGGHHVECTKCGDVFPCRGDVCRHIDCMIATGRKLPDWVKFDLSDVDPLMASILPKDMDVKHFLNRGDDNGNESDSVAVKPIKYLANLARPGTPVDEL